MQKKLIALAVAGLSSAAAFAQSNVTVYGVVDMYYGRAAADGKESQSAINSGGLSGSRIGFKGTEDLGNGLKAIFTLEYALAVDTSENTIRDYDDISGNYSDGIYSYNPRGNGSGIGQARQSFVGLSGNFGTVVAGRLQTAGYDWSGVTNAFHGTAINPLASVQGGMQAGAGLLNSSSRADNAVAYISPEFGGGFKVAYNHARLTESRNDAVTNPNQKDSYANLVSGTYANGPVAVSLVYSKINSEAVAPADAIKEWGIGGSYDFGMVKLFGSYQRQKVDSTGNTDKAWQLSGAIPVSAAGSVVLGYAKNSRDLADRDSKSWTLAYTHGLSKRTTLYTAYQRVDNDSLASRGTALLAPVAGEQASLFVAGVRHSF